MCHQSLIVILILCISIDYTHQYKVLNVTYGHHSTDNHFDLLIFTQSWPPTVCKKWTHHHPNHHCVFPKQKDTWTIHGIWPTKYGTIGPANCNNTWLFDPEQVKPIEDKLEQAWTNVEKETSLYSLWAHEWTKHGTCAAVLPSLNNEYKFFTTGIAFHDKYNMNNILSSANILPSDTNQLNIQILTNAVQSKLGFRPYVSCVSYDGNQYLQELRICFDKQLNPMKCDGIKDEVEGGFLTNCDVTKSIIYPTQSSTPKRILVQLYRFINWIQWLTL